MTSKHYFHISSSFRNRNDFPNQAQFDLLFSNTSSITDPNFAKDPIIEAYPLFGFDFATIPIGPLAFVGGTCLEPIIQTPIAPPSGYDISDNFFTGMEIKDNTLGQTTNISAYDTVTDSLTLDPQLASTWVATDTYTISFPTSVDNTHILIPYGNSNEGAYIGYVLEDVTIGELRTITAYSGSTFIATLASAFGGGWSNTDIYLLRQANPVIYRQNVTSVGTYTYLGTTYQYVELGGTVSSANDFYNNMYFFDTTLYAAGTSPDHSLIYKYFATPPVGSGLPNNVALLKTTLATIANDDYDILSFTRDNYAPLNYFGSVVSSQQPCCYEVELVSLILPNVTLNTTGIGGRAINVPYVYVEFSNYEYGGQTHDLIYSNNPYANRAIFLVSLNDYPQTFNSPYVRVNGGMPIQTIKFKPNDNFRFSVYMPNGELFSTATVDNMSPLSPDNSLQIEMLLSVRRVTPN